MEIILLPKSLRENLSAEHGINSAVDCVTQLVINSLDAKSTSIAIRVNLVSNQIQVIDNGIGLSKQNLQIIGNRYATSKYYTISNIENKVNAFPSRGVALANIINLSKTVHIISKTFDVPTTICKTFEKGKFLSITTVGQRPTKGTTVNIVNFMYNRPVRNKCVNIDALLDEIEKEIKYIAIINPNISFNLRDDANGCILFQTPRTKFVHKTISLIYGNISSSPFKKLYYQDDNISLNGLINLGTYYQNKLQLIYVNRRHIKITKIQSLIHNILMKSKIMDRNTFGCRQQKYFLYIININCPYSEFDIIDYVDLRVEFKNWEAILKCVADGIHTFLVQHCLCEIDPDLAIEGSPIPEPDPSIHVSQVDGIVRGIPTKRKLNNNEEINTSICEKKMKNITPISLEDRNKQNNNNDDDDDDIENNNCIDTFDEDSIEGKKIIRDMFFKSLIAYNTNASQNKDTSSGKSENISLVPSLRNNINSVNMISTITNVSERTKQSKNDSTKQITDAVKTTLNNTIGVQTENSKTPDDFLFKKPLPPKPILIKRKTKVDRFELNKSALDLFKSNETEDTKNVPVKKNLAKQRLEETCARLKNRVYQDHLANQKYKCEMKKTKVQYKLQVKQSADFVQSAFNCTAPANVQPNDCYHQTNKKRCNGKQIENNVCFLPDKQCNHQSSILYPFLKKFYPFYKKTKFLTTLRSKNNQLLENKVPLPIYVLKQSGSIYSRKQADYKTHEDHLKTSKYIFINNDNIVSEKTKPPFEVVRNNRINHENEHFSDVQLSQLLPHISKRNNSSELIKSNDYKRFKNSNHGLNGKTNNNIFKHQTMFLRSKPSFSVPKIRRRNNILKDDFNYSEFSFVPRYNKNKNATYSLNKQLCTKSLKTFDSHLNNKLKLNLNEKLHNTIIPEKMNLDNPEINLNDTESSIINIDLISEDYNKTENNNKQTPKNLETLHRASKFSCEITTNPADFTNKFDLQTPKLTSSDSTKMANLEKNTPVSILTQSKQKQIDIPINPNFEQPNRNTNKIINKNYYIHKNYKYINKWLENSKKYLEKINNPNSSLEISKTLKPDKHFLESETTEKNVLYKTKKSFQINTEKENLFLLTKELNKSPKNICILPKLNENTLLEKSIINRDDEVQCSFENNCTTQNSEKSFISQFAENLKRLNADISIQNDSLTEQNIETQVNDDKTIEEIQINVNPYDLLDSDINNLTQVSNKISQKQIEINDNIDNLHITQSDRNSGLSNLKNPIYSSLSSTSSNNKTSDIDINTKINHKNNSNSTNSIISVSSDHNNETIKDNHKINSNFSNSIISDSPDDNNNNNNNNNNDEIKLIENEICVYQRPEWLKQTTEHGDLFYLNKRTGMTSFLTPKSLDGYSMTKRFAYLPKGMSPILNTSNVQPIELTPNSKSILHETLANWENDELQTVKWMNYFQNKDSAEFFSNLYSNKKHYEIEIPNLNKHSLPKKLRKGFDNYTFTKDNLNNVIIINQCDNKFIVAMIKINHQLDLLVLFDQHAVHERICLEKLLKDYQLDDDKLKSLKCKYPVSLNLENNEIKMLKKYKKNFDNWSLIYEISNDQNVVITHIPLCWKSKDDSHVKQNSEIESLILSLIEEESIWLKKIGRINNALPLVILNTIKTEACRSAIKFGDPLSKEQCEHIIQDLSKCDLPFQCAHGRPTLVPILELTNTHFEQSQIHFNNLKRGNK